MDIVRSACGNCGPEERTSSFSQLTKCYQLEKHSNGHNIGQALYLELLNIRNFKILCISHPLSFCIIYSKCKIILCTPVIIPSSLFGLWCWRLFHEIVQTPFVVFRKMMVLDGNAAHEIRQLTIFTISV